MDSKNRHADSSGNELSLGDIFLSMGAFAQELWKRKWWLILGAVLVAVFFVFKEYQKPIVYRGKLTFMLNEEEGSGGGLASLLGQAAGIGGVGSSNYNVAKIVELSKSQLLVQRLLLDSVNIRGKEELLANHLLDIYSLSEKWREEGREKWAEVRFVGDSVEGMDREERKVLQYLYGLIVGNSERAGILNATTDPITNILTLKGVSLDEEITEQSINGLFDHISAFYIEKTTANPRRTFNMLSVRADSIKTALYSAQSRLAVLEDASSSFSRRRDKVLLERTGREVQMLTLLYTEAIKNVIAAEFALETMTPFFAVIDRPFSPLSRIGKKPVQQGVIGAIIGGFIVAFVVFVYWFVVLNISGVERKS